MKTVKRLLLVSIWPILIMLVVGTISYGVVRLCHYREEKQFQVSQIRRLQEEVYILKSCIHWEIILSDTLSSQEKLELDVIEASLRNKIQKSFPNK